MKFWYKKSLRFFLCMLLCILFLHFPSTNSLAASATIKIEIPTEEVSKEEEFKISIVIASDSTLGDFEGYLSYNAEIIEFISGPACVTGGNGMLRFMDTNASASPLFTRFIATTIEESFFLRIAMTGGSAVSITSDAGMISIRSLG